MYIEHTPQGYNIMGVSPELLDDIIMALREYYQLDDFPKIQKFVEKAEKELINHPS
jgi:hypothetical protein